MFIMAVAGVAALTSAMLAAAPAGAVPAGLASRNIQPGGSVIRTAGGASVETSVTSRNWSGYAATGGTYTSVSATWTVTAVTCSSGNQYSAFWAGLDGFNDGTVEQTGTSENCAGSTPVYQAWYELFPALPVYFSNPVSPGDIVNASVVFDGGSAFTLTLKDFTKGWTQTVNASIPGAARSSAEVIAEAPSDGFGVLPLADFGSVYFRGCRVDGSWMNLTNPTLIEMVNSSKQALDSLTAWINPANFWAQWLRSS